MKSLISVIIVIIILLLILAKYKKEDSPSQKNNLINVNKFRGVMSLLILVHHVVDKVVSPKDMFALYPLTKFSICAVAIFFFCSAYGISSSWKAKDNYLDVGFIISKPISILLIAIVCNLWQLIFEIVINRGLNIRTICSVIFSINWFVYELCGFYLLFYLIYKFCHRYKLLIFMIFTILICSLLYYLNVGQHWYVSMFAFPFGLACGQYYDALLQLLSKWYSRVFIVIISVFGLCSLFFLKDTYVNQVLMKNSITLVTVIILFVVSDFVVLCNNTVAEWLSIYSLEIFFLQRSRTYFSYWFCVTDWPQEIAVTFISTILLSIISHPVLVKIRKYSKKVIEKLYC